MGVIRRQKQKNKNINAQARTLLRGPPPLVQLQRLVVLEPLHRRVAPRPRQRDLHRLVEQVEAVRLVDGLARRVRAVVDDERLPLRLEVRLGHDVDDVAELGEDGAQGLLERPRLDALLEVPHVHAGRGETKVSQLGLGNRSLNLRSVGVQ